MGVTEEAGKTISNVVESMKQSPSCLAVIFLAALFAILTFVSLRSERTEMHERQLALIGRCTFPPPHAEPPFQRN
jgi:hypothetical protein